MTKYTIASNPTNYRSNVFRSRLEARWAAFFDLVGWQWDYEPMDFSGWVPDFVLHGKDGTGKKRIVLVEVKPVFEFPKETGDKIDREYPCPEAEAQAGELTSEREALILGAGLLTGDAIECGELGLGWLREGTWWETAAFQRTAGGLGFCHCLGSFTNRITGEYEGGHIRLDRGEADRIQKFWAEAGNRTRWYKS